MRMQEAMAALNGGQTVDTSKLFGDINRAPADGAGGTSTQARTERNVSLGWRPPPKTKPFAAEMLRRVFYFNCTINPEVFAGFPSSNGTTYLHLVQVLDS